MKKKVVRLIQPNIVFLLLVVGFLLRAININWGAPFYFHPDERNIAALLSQDPFINFPSYLFSGTFSYGNFLTIIFQLPKIGLTAINPALDPFVLSTLIIRYASVVFATATLFIVYKAGTVFSKQAGIISLLLTVFSTGLIQNAHYGTFDTFIAFTVFIAFYFSLLLVKTNKTSYFYFAVLALVCAATAKITSVVFFPIIFLAFLYVLKREKITKKRFSLHTICAGILFLLAPLLSPYYTTPEFINLLQYERGIVTGTLPVFYTQSFRDTIPVLFQFTDIYPFLINPLVTILFPFVFAYCVFLYIRNKDNKILLTLLSFLILFIPQAILFAKWSRYMLPTLPFIYILFGIVLSHLLSQRKRIYRKAAYLFTGMLVAITMLHGISYLIVTHDSSVIRASMWVNENIPPNSSAISEHYDLGVIPFNSTFQGMALYDFYSMEDDPNSSEDIVLLANSADYILLPSQRILKSRIINPTQFPKGNIFYSSLYYETGNFEKIYETECSLLCQFLYGGNPVFQSEETTNVFDRPTVTIYRRIR